MYDVLVTFIMMMIFHDHDDDYVKRKGGVCMLGDVVIGRFSVKKKKNLSVNQVGSMNFSCPLSFHTLHPTLGVVLYFIKLVH